MSFFLLQAFDELLLLKRGGKVIYNGPTGKDSADLVSYFEGIEGVPKLQGGINPATWMLEISTVSAEERLGQDFSDIYAQSDLFRFAKAVHAANMLMCSIAQHGLLSCVFFTS